MRMNLDKINHIKRKKIEKGIDLIEKWNAKEKIIDKMIIFGSAVTVDCSEESDIDVCLVSDFTTAKKEYFKVFGGLESAMDDLCDIFNFGKIDGKLREEVVKKGVIVYEYP